MTTIVVRRRIEWIDTDAAGIYHWTTALRLVEAAEAAMHTQLGIVDRTFGRTPRVSVDANFRRPLRFNDITETRLAVERVGRTSLDYRFLLTGPAGTAVDGWLTVCYVSPETGRPEPWPDDLRRALETGGELTPGS
jgi:acyl-CoA thioester hydrolase